MRRAGLSPIVAGQVALGHGRAKMSKEQHYVKGMEHFGDDRLDLAIEELKKAVMLDSKYGDALHALAMCYYHQEDIDHALEYGKQFRDVEPANPLAYTSLSMFYNAKGMIQQAEEMGAKARSVGGEEDSGSVSLS